MFIHLKKFSMPGQIAYNVLHLRRCGFWKPSARRQCWKEMWL